MVANAAAGNSPVGQPRPSVIRPALMASTLTYADNTTQSVNIPRSEVLRYIQIDISCQPTAAAGWTAANLGAADAASIFTDLQLIRNGGDIHTEMTGEIAMLLANRWYGSTQFSSVGTVGTANPVLTATILIPFETPNIRKPFSTMFNTGKCSGVTLQASFGNYATVLSTATAWTAAPKFTITLGFEFWPPNAQKQDTTPIFFFRRFKKHAYTIPAGTQTDFPVTVPLNTVYHGFLLNGAIMATANKIKLSSGSTTIQTWSIPGKGNLQRLRRNVNPTLGVTSTASNNANTYWLEVMPDGMTTQLLNARGISDLSFLLSTGSTNPGGTLTWYSSEIFGTDYITG